MLDVDKFIEGVAARKQEDRERTYELAIQLLRSSDPDVAELAKLVIRNMPDIQELEG